MEPQKAFSKMRLILVQKDENTMYKTNITDKSILWFGESINRGVKYSYKRLFRNSNMGFRILRQPLPCTVGPAWPSQAGFCAPFCPFMTLSFPEFSSFLLLLFPQGNCFHFFYFDGKTGFKGPLT